MKPFFSSGISHLSPFAFTHSVQQQLLFSRQWLRALLLLACCYAMYKCGHGFGQPCSTFDMADDELRRMSGAPPRSRPATELLRLSHLDKFIDLACHASTGSLVAYNNSLTATILRGSHSEDSTPSAFALMDVKMED